MSDCAMGIIRLPAEKSAGMRKAEGHPAAKERCRAARDKNLVPRQWTWHYYPPPGTTTRRHFPCLRILPFCVLRRRFAFRRVLLYLCSANKDRARYGALFLCLKGCSTVWATDFSVAQTVKTVAQTVSSDWATVKSVRETGKFAAHSVKLL